LKLFYATIDKNYEGKCAGMGIYFILAKNRREARKIAQKRCDEEREYDDAYYWEIYELKEISQDMKLIDFLQNEGISGISWLLLK
jgi:hypothetical protein